jgi:DNA-binding XRE family transcriptional regulator
MAELEDGRTLAQVIELSRATLVVLDKDRVAPFARLYENACCCCCLFNCARLSSTCVLA